MKKSNMYTLFSRIILSNWRSLITLFVVLIFASTSFVTLRQITTNVDAFVTSKTKPLFGADIIVSSRSYATGNIFPMIAPALIGEAYTVAEKREFSTTLIDNENKTGLVQVVAYSGSYPQGGILQTEVLSGTSIVGDSRVAATPNFIEKFSKNGVFVIDGKSISISEKILESSDLGFSLGTENHLIILPDILLSGSSLLSSGSRLEQSLLISFTDESRSKGISEKLKKILPENLYRVRTYEERTERNLDTVDTLTDYITLILLVSSIFAFIILRSSHEGFYENLAHTLRITEILGLSRKRQQILLLLLYGLIFPLAFLISIGVSYGILELIAQFPDAKDFRFYGKSLILSFLLLLSIVVMAWFPIWWKMSNREESENMSIYRVFQRVDTWVTLLLGIGILSLLFKDIKFIAYITIGGGLFYLIFGGILRKIYEFIFHLSGRFRKNRFYIYDALRSLVRPLTPTIPITISLVSVTVFFLVFASFSLAFRSKLIVDSTNTANIYAINILDSDKEKVQNILSSGALMYDILRARVIKINDKSLEEHFATEKVSGEFTREFNITTTPLDNKILSGKKEIGKGEVSIDNDFSKRLGVKIGDTITFLLSGREIPLKVVNIRESIREGFRPFFYFSFDPNQFQSAPRTYFVAEYAKDTEAWKQSILGSSGPHVTFIDIESILKIVRDISSKILSILGLFFLIVFLFALGAIFAFFARMKPIEAQKTRLYSLFGASREHIRTSLFLARNTIFGVSYILSILIGGALSYYVLSRGGFFSFSFGDFLLLMGITGGIYSIIAMILKK